MTLLERFLPNNIGTVEVAGAGGVCAVLALLTIWVWSLAGGAPTQDEGIRMVDAIRQAVIDRAEAFTAQGVIPTEWAPRSPTDISDGQAVEWVTNDGFTRLGWQPGEIGITVVRGAYRVARTKEGFRVEGRIDADADGEVALIEADQDNPARQSNEGVD